MRTGKPDRPTRPSPVEAIPCNLLLATLFAMTSAISPPDAAAKASGQIARISVALDGTQGNGNSGLGSFSADGRYVTFVSSATNLVAGDTNGVDDVFVYDRQTHQTTRVSVSSSGTQGDRVSGSGGFNPVISGDGRYVAFTS